MRSNAVSVMRKIADKIKRMQNEVPLVLANEGQKVFNENFSKQSFEGEKWEEVKRREPGTFEYKYPKKAYLARRTNPILVGKTRRLKNAVNRAIKNANQARIVWGVSVPYAAYHNFGEGQKKRTFMEADYVLKRRLRTKYLQIIRTRLR